MTSATLIEKCCLIAHPAAGNPTQYVVELALAQKGLDWRFMTFDVDPQRLADAMRGLRALGFHGIKIGRPFYEAVIEHLDELTAPARECGSVNCVTAQDERLVGDSTEGAAFVDLLRQQMNPLGRRALVIGSGRLARILAIALAGAGVESIGVMSRNAEAGRQLVERIQHQTAADAAFHELGVGMAALESDVAIVVNATSIGTQDPDASLPINLESLHSKMIVADVAYTTARTWLTQQAAERGCRVIDGLSLYVEQTALALRAWTGFVPDTVDMREAAEEFLGV